MRNKRFIKLFAIILAVFIAVTCLTACGKTDKGEDDDINRNLDLSTPVSITIAGRSLQSWPALEAIITKFEQKYNNCTVTYEYVQGNDDVMLRRFESETDKVDIVALSNVQNNTPYYGYTIDLLSRGDILDLSETNEGLVDNFRYFEDTTKLYAIPYGGEMRGMYVNKTLLNKLNLSVPTNRAEFLNCCAVLLENGYVPLQSSNGDCAQQLLYPSICNKIANSENYEETHASIDAIYDDISEFVEDEFAFFYGLIENGYYDYKRVEEAPELGYAFSGDQGKSENFFDLGTKADNSIGSRDPDGKIAFMTGTQALQLVMEQVKTDYHCTIDYEFILSPVGEEGGYAYLSPSTGLGVNKNSDNIDWALEFLDFFFKAENNEEFAAIQGCIPNTSDAMVKYNAPANRTSTVGQATFSYNFYKTVTPLLLNGYKDAYIEATANYVKANPAETFYYAVVDAADSITGYAAADATYRAANPTAALYRHSAEMIGLSKANAQKYMDVAYSAANTAYITANPDAELFYLDGTTYTAATTEYRTANPSATLYKATYSLKFTLEEYLARLEEEFQVIKESR